MKTTVPEHILDKIKELTLQGKLVPEIYKFIKNENPEIKLKQVKGRFTKIINEKSKFDPDLCEKIKEAFYNGVSIYEMRKLLKKDRELIQRYLKFLNLSEAQSRESLKPYVIELLQNNKFNSLIVYEILKTEKPFARFSTSHTFDIMNELKLGKPLLTEKELGLENLEILEKVRVMFNAKKTQEQMCQELGVTLNVVRMARRKQDLLNGTKIMNSYEESSYPKELIDKVKKIYEDNPGEIIGARAVAEKIGENRCRVKKLLHIIGIENKSGGHQKIKQQRTEKTCIGCGETKSIDQFDPYTTDNGLFKSESRCDPCLRKQIKDRKIRNGIRPENLLRRIISNNIRKYFRSKNSRKDNSTVKSLNYTFKELKIHIENKFESWMTWDNNGIYNPDIWDDNDPSTWTWHLDHIRPHSTFNYNSMEDQTFKDCWSLSNLRPLSSKQNVIDGGRRTRHKPYENKKEDV